MSQILDINLESDLSEFGSTVTDGGDLSQSGSAALGGTSGGMSLVIDDTNDIYGQNTFTTFSSHTHRYRFYIDPNSLGMSTNDSITVVDLAQTGHDRQSECYLHYDGSNYEIRAGVKDDSSTWQYTSYYDITDAEHYVEVRVVEATGSSTNDGTLDLWIDGVHQEQVGSIDLYDTNNLLGMSRLGAQTISADEDGSSFYLDEYVLRDDATEIGGLGTIVAPTASSAVAATVDPTVLLGSLALTPDPASAVAVSIDPTVLLGSVSITPSPASAVAATVDPFVLTPFIIEQLDPAGTHTALAAVGDILHLKGLVDTAIEEMWVEVESVSDQTTHYEYTVVIESGTPAEFPAGTTFTNYGTSGDGLMRSISEGTYPPYIETLTHSGEPWTTVVRHAVMGNLQGFTGQAEWGIAVGADLDAFSDNWLVLSEDRFRLNRDLDVSTGKGFQFDDGGTDGWVLTEDGSGLYVPGPVSMDDITGGDAEFVVMSLSANLANERVLTGGDSLTLTDGGANGNATLDLDTPGTLTVATGNAAAAPHTHAITSSSSPGIAASILATDANGDVGVQDLTVAEYINHEGDADTYMRYTPDYIAFVVGGTTFTEWIEGASDYIAMHEPIVMDTSDWIGNASNDIRIVFASSSGQLNMHLGDAAGSDEVRVIDSGGTPQTTIDSDGNIETNGNFTSAEYLYHLGDLDTYIRFQNDQITLSAGGVVMLDLDEDTTDVATFTSGVKVAVGSIDSNFVTDLSINSFVCCWHDGDDGSGYVGSAYGSGSTMYPRFIGRRAGGTSASPSAAQSGYTMARLGAGGYGATGMPDESTGFMQVEANQNFTDSAMGTRITFWTTDDNTIVPDERLRITDDGIIMINESANAEMTTGLTINQGTADDEIIALKSTEVGHGMTVNTETDTYGFMGKIVGANGGLDIRGLTGVTRGLQLSGYGVTDDTGKTTSDSAYVEIRAGKKSGTTASTCGTDANLLGVFNWTTLRFIFDAEGSAHSDVEWTTFDEYDDLALLNSLESSFGEFADAHREELESLGIATFDETPGHAMINWTRLNMLLVGAIRQMNERMEQMSLEIGQYKALLGSA